MKRELMKLLGRISHMHRYAVDEMISAFGMSVGQPPVLWYLSEHDGCIQRDIAANLRIRAASVSSVLDKMEQDGYIERRGAKDDRRAQCVFMTDVGRDMHREIARIFDRLEDICLHGIDREELQSTLATLRRIAENIERHTDFGRGDDHA